MDEEDKAKNSISKNQAAEINRADTVSDATATATVSDPPKTASLRCD